mgnify:CR=1 FL=1
MTNWILIFLAVNIVIYSVILSNFLSRSFLNFLNIGQGNSVLIFNRRNVFLYDTGPSGFRLLKELRNNLPPFQKTIDVLFLSHPDKDHYGGTEELISRYKVRIVLIPFIESKESGWLQLLQKLQQNRIKIIKLRIGDIVKTKDFQIAILNPPTNFKLNDNDASLVLKIQRKHSYLLTGDIEQRGVKNLINCCRDLIKSEIILVPHHGSKYSLNFLFWQLVNPSLAIIQVGKNNYGHPHREVLETFHNLNIHFKRTDLDGEIKFIEF